MRTKILIFLIPLFLLASCRGNIHDLIDPTDFLEVNNIYETLDMSCFYGLVDNITIPNLIEIYGEPDSIYDAYESTTIEGYDIYEYRVDDGTIDCYVPKKEEKGTATAVEYIYFEPNCKIDVSSFIKDEVLCNNISSSKNNVYYIVDRNRNFIRIRLDKNDKTKILNIAINDVTLLDIYHTDIVEIVKEIKGSLPRAFTDLGTLTNLEFNDNCLTFHIDVNETDTINLYDILNKNPGLAEAITQYIMYNQGFLGYADNSLLKRKSDISYKLKGKITNQISEINIPYYQLKSLIGTNVTNEKALLGKMLIDNCLCPMRLNDWIIGEKKYIKDNCLIIPYKVTVNSKELEYLSSDFKNYSASLFMDFENPESIYVSFAYKCNYDMNVVFYIDGTEDKLVAKFDQDDLWSMLENTK